MNFFKRADTSQMEDASEFQLALLNEAERNIYGDTLIWSKKDDTDDNKENNKYGTKGSIYGNIFDKSDNREHQFSASNLYESDDYVTGKSLFPVLDHFLYFFPMWITRDRRFALINIIGIFITLAFASFYRFVIS